MTVVTADRRFTGVGEDFGVRKGTLSVHLHTTEPSDPAKTTVRDAIALHIYQDRDDTVGSYNRIVCTDGVLRCMEDDHASGGINPFSDYFSPRSWLFDFLPDYAVGDPNGYGVNLAAMGRKAHFDQYGWPARIIDGFARSIIEYEDMVQAKTGKRPNLVIDQHADYQPGNRTDAGSKCLDLVMKRYRELVALAQLPDTAIPVPSVEHDVINDYLKGATFITNRTARVGAGATARSTPEFNPKDYDANKVFSTPATGTGSKAPAIAWVKGTNLTLADGTVFDARTRWAALWNATNGVTFWHERDVIELMPTESSPAADCSAQEAQVADLQLALSQRDAAIATKNGALDEAIAHEKPHVDLSTKLAAARKA